MIKCPHTPAVLKKFAADFYTLVESQFQVSTKIAARALLNDEATPIFNYLNTNIKQIITGEPSILENHATLLLPLLNTAKAAYALNHTADRKAVNKWVRNTFFPIFNYDYDHLSFTKFNNGRLAYDHAIKLQINTCPYCNAQFTFTIKSIKSKTRPQFDHFLSKSKHPYLALSFYNLIPSCYVCNSNLKGSKKFSVSTHLHPFIDGMESTLHFRTNIDSVDFLLNKKNFEVRLLPKKTAKSNELRRAKKNSDVFAIEDRYALLKDVAAEIIKKSHIYNYSKIKELLENYTENGIPLFSSESEIIELLMCNYLREDKLHLRILSKLTRDIADEFNIHA